MFSINHNKKALVNFSYTLISPINKLKGAPLWNYLHSKQRGSVTIEAAAVCTLAVVTLGTMLSFFILLKTEFELKQEMYNYVQWKLIWEEEREEVTEYTRYQKVSMIGRAGKIRIGSTLKEYGFCGYLGEILYEETYVYITKYGTVYHKSLSCSHLNLHISEVTYSEIESARNASGGKYYPCEYCDEHNAEGIYYITTYGECYHSNKDCRGLLRNVEKILLKEAESLEECSDCWN